MNFLMLTQGDPIGLDLLKKMVEARYGMHPPAIESARVSYEGTSEANLGPIPFKAHVNAVATYHFPFLMKWDFKLRMLRFMRSSYATSFDGEAVYERQGGKVTRSTEASQVASARHRAWAETVTFISPLIADHNVRVEGIDSRSFRILAPGFPETVAIARLGEGNRLDAVEVNRTDPNDGKIKVQRLVLCGELKRVGDLILPERLERYWADHLFMTLRPVAVELNPTFSAGEFALAGENLLAVLDEDEDEDHAGRSPDDETPDEASGGDVSDDDTLDLSPGV